MKKNKKPLFKKLSTCWQTINARSGFDGFIKIIIMLIGILNIYGIAIAQTTGNKFLPKSQPFVTIAPSMTFNGFGVGYGGGISIGENRDHETHAANVDFHYAEIKGTIDLYIDKYSIDARLLSIPVTYDYTAKTGDGDIKFLYGTGVGLDLYLFFFNQIPYTSGNQNIDEGINNTLKKFGTPLLAQLLITPRVGLEWNIDGITAIGINLRGFVALPIYELSRGAVDASLRFNF
ncbi:MAG: hypothetical protein ACR2NY_04120 [Alphaproteobacteria bacterium]